MLVIVVIVTNSNNSSSNNNYDYGVLVIVITIIIVMTAASRLRRTPAGKPSWNVFVFVVFNCWLVELLLFVCAVLLFVFVLFRVCPKP